LEVLLWLFLLSFGRLEEEIVVGSKNSKFDSEMKMSSVQREKKE